MRSALRVALDAAAATRPHRLALEDAAGSGVAWRALGAAVRMTADALCRSGAAPVAVLAGNGIDVALVHLASLCAGVPLVPVPTFASDEQLAHAVRAAGVRRVLTDDPDRVQRALGATARPDRGPLSDLGPALLAFAVTADRVGPREERVTFTSGTTGAPKGVRLRGETLLRVARSLTEATNADRTERHLALLPLGVLLEETGGLLRTLLSGGTVVLGDVSRFGTDGACRADGRRLAAALAAHRATSIVCVPQVLDALVTELERSGTRLPSLRFVGVGGAHVSPALLARANAVDVPAFEGYGLTEAASVVTLNIATARRAGTVGKPLPHAEVRISEDGEILVRGATFAGYVGDDSVRPAVGRDDNGRDVGARDADDWWPTGDLGHVDADGFVHIEGRRRNVFVTSYGRNVSPEWIEARLAACPSIAQAVVLGESMPRPVAVIVCRGTREEVDADLARVAATLPEYARPARWIEAREPFTAANGLATPNGRPLRPQIARAYAPAGGTYLENSETPVPLSGSDDAVPASAVGGDVPRKLGNSAAGADRRR